MRWVIGQGWQKYFCLFDAIDTNVKTVENDIAIAANIICVHTAMFITNKNKYVKSILSVELI